LGRAAGLALATFLAGALTLAFEDFFAFNLLLVVICPPLDLPRPRGSASFN
jgi:hypothetical protein